MRLQFERRVHRRFVSAPGLVAGHDAFGQGVLVEVGAQARHSVGEVADVDADERAFGDAERRPGVAEEVGEARRVDDVDLGFLPFEAGEAGGERVLAGDFFVIEVRDGCRRFFQHGVAKFYDRMNHLVVQCA